MPDYGPSEKITVGKDTILKKIHVATRILRKNSVLLGKLGIENPDAKKFYEYDSDSSEISYIGEYTYRNLSESEKIRAQRATIFEYKELNPKGRLCSVILHYKDGHPQEFKIIPNRSAFTDNHFVAFAHYNGNVALKQVFHPNGTLYFVDDLFTQLNNSGYSLFFNCQGAGHSMNTMHYQLLKKSFPAFEHFNIIYPKNDCGLTLVTKHDWPFPGILARYTEDTKDKVLSALENEIKLWLSSNSEHTFNLLFRCDNGLREFFFVFREKGVSFIKGISNAIGSYEVSGNILIEDRMEYDVFPVFCENLELVQRAH